MKAFVRLAFILVILRCPLDAGAGAVEIRITLTSVKSDCVASVEGKTSGIPPYRLSESNREVPIWSFSNKCGAKQKVHVCATSKNPQINCFGDPSGAAITTEFAIEDTKKATVSCGIDWKNFGKPGCTPSKDCPTYGFYVANGPADQKLTCPRGPELALEVDP